MCRRRLWPLWVVVMRSFLTRVVVIVVVFCRDLIRFPCRLMLLVFLMVVVLVVLL